MNDNVYSKHISEALMIARKLNELLHEDALHRLQLYKEYAEDADSPRWDPNLYQRCQLAEALCRKLDNLTT